MAAITVDLWHTLIYLTPADEEAYMQNQLTIGKEVLVAAPRRPGAPDLSDDEIGKAFERAYSAAVAASSEGRSVTPAEQLENAARATGRAASPEDYLRGLKEEIRHTNFRVAPGALDFLSTARGNGYRLAVISNTVGEPGAYLRPTLRSIGFDRYVESYVFSDEHPWTKPSPKIFDYALSQIAETPAAAVHVGDSWADLEGARRAHFRGEILFTGLHSYGARYQQLFMPGVPAALAHQHETDRLADVLPLVEKIFAGRPAPRSEGP